MGFRSGFLKRQHLTWALDTRRHLPGRMLHNEGLGEGSHRGRGSTERGPLIRNTSSPRSLRDFSQSHIIKSPSELFARPGHELPLKSPGES